MKKRLLLLPIAALTLAACQETLEERCVREAKTYTEKNCPANIDPNTTIDSMAFDVKSHTMCYYYTLSGPADSKEVMAKVNPRKALLEVLRNSTSTKDYKDAGYNFKYIYRSKSKPGTVLFEATFTKNDY